MLDFYVKTRVRFSLRDKRVFEITEVEITRVDCISLIDEVANGNPIGRLQKLSYTFTNDEGQVRPIEPCQK